MNQHPSYEELVAKLKTLELELAAVNKKTGNTVIRQLSEDFRELADRSPDAIYQYDIESRTFSFFNKQFLSLYSMKADGKSSLSPKSVLLHIHPDDHEKIRTAQTQSFASQNSTGEVEYRYLSAEGDVRLLHDRWTVVRDQQGRPAAIEGYIRDYTWRKRAEAEFERSMRNSLIGCYIVQEAKFQYVNPEFTRITSYSEAELIGTLPLKIVQQEHRRNVRENFIKMLKGERDFPYEFRITDKNGNTKWIMETATSIMYKEKRAGLGFFMDISKSKEVEKERLEKEKLLSILEMAGAVGHELNNPLQVVVTCIENLAPAPDDDQRKSEYYRLLKTSIDKIRKTVRKFQNVTKYATKDYVQGEKIFDIDAASQD